LRIIDTTTGASTLVGAFPGGAEVDSFGFATGGAADVPWLSEDPVSGTVPADGSLDITVTFDPATLSQPGDYMAELKIKHDSPYTYANIPVTLHLTAPATFGTLNGTVYALEACDVNPLPLQGATVNFYDDLGVLVASATTLADGSYTWALEAGTYDIEVLAAGYIDQMMEDVVLAEGATVTTDFTLRLDAPCITVTPEFLEESLMPDTTKTVQLTLENIGAAAGDFEIAEFEAALLNADVELILDDGSRDNGIGIGGSSQFIFLNRFTPPADAYPFELTEIQVFFGSEDLVTVGDEMKLVVYENVTGNTDPAVGSNYLAGFPVTVQSVGAWNIYTLPEPVMLFGPGDVLIGVIALELPGSSYYPAAIDETATQERSWAGWWTTPTAPEVPTLPPDSDWTLIDAYFPGNWMVRGMGSSASADIVWLSEDPVAGTVPADSSLDVDVTFDATGMALGDYNARLRVAGMATGSVFVPVTMHVVSDLNQAPVAVADAYTMNEDTILTIDAPGVLNNDSDPDSDPITAVLVSDVTNGTLALAADGSFVYTPDADYFGTDTFTYKANDGELDSNVVTVTITINDVPDVRYIFLPIILK
ncbi:MAG TPA: Ig-like domain-containing protein, partial [Anaerolineaceae bacterium]|nr:Ig-like domain-containing protein [Anaerolineaceae bacterium]HQH85121.1 Ig-like domain-containing protein [Anaerolineaceae bacterium]